MYGRKVRCDTPAFLQRLAGSGSKFAINALAICAHEHNEATLNQHLLTGASLSKSCLAQIWGKGDSQEPSAAAFLHFDSPRKEDVVFEVDVLVKVGFELRERLIKAAVGGAGAFGRRVILAELAD